jgi:micrococcal nuclease
MRFRSTAIGLMSVMLLGASAPVAALPTVNIKSCYDGDTCTTTTGEKVRLACIDTPELKGENAKPAPAMAAKYHLNGMLISQKVSIRRITTDRYGRTVAELFINGANVQQSMVASGHAEIFWRFASQCPWTR